MLNILNIIISPDSVWFEQLSKINESHGHIAKKFNFSRENLNKQSLLYPYLKKLLNRLINIIQLLRILSCTMFIHLRK